MRAMSEDVTVTVRPRVVVVVLNWNQPTLTLDCLVSLQSLDYENYHVLVVDNGSTDDSVARIRAAYPATDLLALPSNLGYAEGNNRGIARALALGAEYVLILNNDTLVAPDMLSQLVDFAATRPQLALAGPTVYCTDPPTTLFAAGGAIAWRDGLTTQRGMYQPETTYPVPTAPQAVDFVSGCACLVTRHFLETAGLLDPRYYLNFEDTEWCVRARRLGFEVWYVPAARLWHRVSATLGEASPANTYYMTRNALLFFWNNGPLAARPLALTRILLRTGRTVGAWSLKPAYRSDLFRRKRDANLMALRDFCIGRLGRMGPDVARVCYGG